ncbi:MAG: alpha/beta hydrolase [Actinomycetota bacterium]
MAGPLDVRYTNAGGPRIGYQEWGDPTGVPVLLLTPLAQNIDLLWEDPAFAAFAAALGVGHQMIWFDARGTGVSDRVAADYSLEAQAADVLAVLDAVGLDHAHLIGAGDGALVAIHVAAIAPERVRSLALVNAAAGYLDVPVADRDLAKRVTRSMAAELAKTWGSDESIYLEMFSRSRMHDSGHVEWTKRYLRQASSPGHVQDMFAAKIDIDPEASIAVISTPTVVIANDTDPYMPLDASRFLATALQGELVVFEGADHLPWCGSTAPKIVDTIAAFVAGGAASARTAQNKLAVALVSQIDPPAGDEPATSITNAHRRIAGQVIALYGGSLVPAADGDVVATFDGAVQALSCARQILMRLSLRGIPARSGLHAGEFVFGDGQVSGPAFDVAAGAASAGAAPSLLVTHTVKGLLGGTGIEITPAHVTTLPGVDGEWALYNADDTQDRLLELGYSATFLDELAGPASA